MRACDPDWLRRRWFEQRILWHGIDGHRRLVRNGVHNGIDDLEHDEFYNDRLDHIDDNRNNGIDDGNGHHGYFNWCHDGIECDDGEHGISSLICRPSFAVPSSFEGGRPKLRPAAGYSGR